MVMSKSVTLCSFDAVQKAIVDETLETINNSDSQEKIAARLEHVRHQFNIDEESFCQLLSKIVALDSVEMYCESPIDDLRAVVLGIRKEDEPLGIVFKKKNNICLNHKPERKVIICETNMIDGIYILSGGGRMSMKGTAIVPIDDGVNYAVWRGDSYALEGPAFAVEKLHACEVLKQEPASEPIRPPRTQTIRHQSFINQQTLEGLQKDLDVKGVRYRKEGSSLVLDDPEEGIDFVEIQFDRTSSRFQALSMHTPEMTAVYDGGVGIDMESHAQEGQEIPADRRLELNELIWQYVNGQFLSPSK